MFKVDAKVKKIIQTSAKRQRDIAGNYVHSQPITHRPTLAIMSDCWRKRFPLKKGVAARLPPRHNTWATFFKKRLRKPNRVLQTFFLPKIGPLRRQVEAYFHRILPDRLRRVGERKTTQKRSIYIPTSKNVVFVECGSEAEILTGYPESGPSHNTRGLGQINGEAGPRLSDEPTKNSVASEA